MAVESHRSPFVEVEDAPAYRWSFAEPTGWARVHDGDSQLWGELFDEQAVVHGPHGSGFYVRANLEIPVVDVRRDLVLTVWVSVSGAVFERMHRLWDDPRREQEPSYFAQLCNRVPNYPDTWHLAALVRTQPIGRRPLVDLEPSDHPLVVDQRRGITTERAVEISNAFECLV